MVQSKTEVIIYQVNSKGELKIKVYGDDLRDAVETFYRGLKSQESRGKSWLQLSKGQAVYIKGIEHSKYAVPRLLAPKNWTIEEMYTNLDLLLSHTRKNGAI